MSLFIGSALDAPHSRHPYGPASTACGLGLVGMREITELQALVWLGNRRCKACAEKLDLIARATR